jgi:hypothetical protein
MSITMMLPPSSISTRASLLTEFFPLKQLKLVAAWSEIHKEELLADWKLAMNGEHPFKIDPLK